MTIAEKVGLHESIGHGRFALTIRVGSATSEATAREYLHRRAADLCIGYSTLGGYQLEDARQADSEKRVFNVLGGPDAVPEGITLSATVGCTASGAKPAGEEWQRLRGRVRSGPPRCGYRPEQPQGSVSRRREPRRRADLFLLAVIVERASKKTFAEHANKAIFEPLGMKRTRFRDDHTAWVAHRAQGTPQRTVGMFYAQPCSESPLHERRIERDAEVCATE